MYWFRIHELLIQVQQKEDVGTSFLHHIKFANNRIQDGPAHEWVKKAHLPKIYHTYSAMVELGTVIP